MTRAAADEAGRGHSGRRDPAIVMKHGAGGRAMRRLIQETLTRGFVDVAVDGYGIAAMDDGAALRLGDRWLIVTTDSHVVQPAFFPGGDIGRLAVAGTVNDLAMMGATEPMGLTCALIVEEGFTFSDLERVQQSMVDTCREAGTTVVTGDTKVMGRGELDGVVINTTGVAIANTLVRDSGLAVGDRIVVTGNVGDHGMALMAHRHHLAIDAELYSDVAPINRMIRDALAARPGAVSAMKDPTRGGLSSALHEMAEKANVGMQIREELVPVNPVVRAVAEMLGLDPMHVANEGKAVLGVRGGDAAVQAVLAALRRHPAGANAAVVGECVATRPGDVVLDTGLGKRLLSEYEGELLPRIC
ncbi:MAG: hydrogenase expression/formation protein HypE [Gemmatimonadota bacterium]|nr:hydrogenase expression/formation protein HypE [Gemmatimonadota bacterium]